MTKKTILVSHVRKTKHAGTAKPVIEVTSETPNEMTLACMKATQDNNDMHGPFNSIDELREDLNADY